MRLGVLGTAQNLCGQAVHLIGVFLRGKLGILRKNEQNI